MVRQLHFDLRWFDQAAICKAKEQCFLSLRIGSLPLVDVLVWRIFSSVLVGIAIFLLSHRVVLGSQSIDQGQCSFSSILECNVQGSLVSRCPLKIGDSSEG